MTSSIGLGAFVSMLCAYIVYVSRRQSKCIIHFFFRLCSISFLSDTNIYFSKIVLNEQKCIIRIPLSSKKNKYRIFIVQQRFSQSNQSTSSILYYYCICN